MDEIMNNVNDINEEATEVTEEAAVEETVEAPAEETATAEATEIADDFSEDVMEVALSVDENGNLIEKQEEELSGLTEKQKRRKMIFDKITTGILIFLLASPVLILLYIFLWFIFR